MNMDLAIFSFINGYAKKFKALDFLGIFCAKYLGIFMIVVLAAVSYVTSNRDLFLAPLAAGGISLLLNEGIYIFYKRKRPMEIISDNVLIRKPFSPAFPSSHTSFFFALSFTLALFNVPLVLIFVALSCVISLARVFCGVHWPSDILAGVGSAVISFLVLYIIIIVL